MVLQNDLRTGQDPGGMIRYEPLRPVSFPVLARCPVFTVGASLPFSASPTLFYFLFETNYTGRGSCKVPLWQVGCEVQIGGGEKRWFRLQPLSLAIGE